MAGPVKGPKRPFSAVLGLLPAPASPSRSGAGRPTLTTSPGSSAKAPVNKPQSRRDWTWIPSGRSQGQGWGGLSLPLSTQGDPHGLRGEGVCPGGSD